MPRRVEAVELGGQCDSRFDAVRGAFAANFDPDRPLADAGASVAVTIEGELVVDLWAGTVDTDGAGTGDGTAAPWERDTIVNECFARGLLVLGAGKNAIRISPPLVLNKAQASTAVEILDQALSQL